MSMLCRQCEQTAGGKSCTTAGVCGKTSDTAALQDLLVHGLQGIAIYGQKAGELGIKNKEADLFIIEGLFTTITNVNFDPEKIRETINSLSFARLIYYQIKASDLARKIL